MSTPICYISFRSNSSRTRASRYLQTSRKVSKTYYDLDEAVDYIKRTKSKYVLHKKNWKFTEKKNSLILRGREGRTKYVLRTRLS